MESDLSEMTGGSFFLSVRGKNHVEREEKEEIFNSIRKLFLVKLNRIFRYEFSIENDYPASLEITSSPNSRHLIRQ